MSATSPLPACPPNSASPKPETATTSRGTSALMNTPRLDGACAEFFEGSDDQHVTFERSEFLTSTSSESPPGLSAEASRVRNAGGPPQGGRGLRRLFAIAVFAAILGLGITLSFGYADHDPRPHGVRIAVAASPAVRAHVAAGLERAQPGGFDVISVASAQAAAHSVRSQSNAGALIVPASGPATIVTAGAEGLTQKQALTNALTAASAAMHRTDKPLDVAPLPPGDSSGLSTFAFGLGLLIPSVIGSVGIFLLGMRLRLWWRVAAATLFALLAAVGGVVALDPILGALTGAGAALIGIGFLGALSFVLFIAALQALVGLPGTALAAVAFVFVGNAISGGSVPIGFLPGGFRQIAPWLPNNAIVRAVRDVVYFNGHDLGHPLLVLALWPAVALVILAAVDALHVSERRRTPQLAQDIYRTPAIVHMRRRLETRPPHTDTTPAASSLPA
jgi:hypothetical protein